MRSVDRDNHTMNEGTADSTLSSRRLRDRCPLNATEIIWKETGPPLKDFAFSALFYEKAATIFTRSAPLKRTNGVLKKRRLQRSTENKLDKCWAKQESFK